MNSSKFYLNITTLRKYTTTDQTLKLLINGSTCKKPSLEFSNASIFCAISRRTASIYALAQTFKAPNQITNLEDGQRLKKSEALYADYIPVYVMLPLNVINKDSEIENRDKLQEQLVKLKSAHVDGLMVDVWWGIVEGETPKQYDWRAYRDLFTMILELNFKIQAIMSFHQHLGSGEKKKDNIPLPRWILDISSSNPDIFFTNKRGNQNKECLTFGVDNEHVLNERTAIEVYTDFMGSFKENMFDFLDSGLITEIHVGLGPAGELRYPSFARSQGWKFPGIGEFQCYDKYLTRQLQEAAILIGHPEWGTSATPEDAGEYNAYPDNTGFFSQDGTYLTDKGKFFLTWYSNTLLQHGDIVLSKANEVFEGLNVKLAAKVAGIHWWYKSNSHAAELAAGYYNLDDRDGYRPIARMLSRHHAVLNFTCLEMQDTEHPPEAACGPEELVRKVLNAGWREGIEIAAENALARYDRQAYRQILRNARARPSGLVMNAETEIEHRRRISAFTYLRLSDVLMKARNLNKFEAFVREMHASYDYQLYEDCLIVSRIPLRRSEPKREIEEILLATVSLEPFSFEAQLEDNRFEKFLDMIDGMLDQFERAWEERKFL